MSEEKKNLLLSLFFAIGLAIAPFGVATMLGAAPAYATNDNGGDDGQGDDAGGDDGSGEGNGEGENGGDTDGGEGSGGETGGDGEGGEGGEGEGNSDGSAGADTSGASAGSPGDTGGRQPEQEAPTAVTQDQDPEQFLDWLEGLAKFASALSQGGVCGVELMLTLGESTETCIVDVNDYFE